MGNMIYQKLGGMAGMVQQVRPLHKALALSQVLSFLIAVMGTTSGLLAEHGINMPTTQSLVNYVALMLTFGVYHLKVHGRKLTNPLWAYLLLAFLDVEGNFLVTKAYEYTSITSVNLLDCFTIPSVMFLSWVVFKARYSVGHYAGAGLCIAGLTVLVVTDSSSSTSGSNPLLGDALVIFGATVYAVCNITQERLLSAGTSAAEMLAALGLCGTLVAGTQAAILERGAWAAATWDSSVVGPLLGFAGSLYIFYVSVPRVLTWSSSNVLNLSLLSSDFWAAGSRVMFFGGFGGSGLYFLLALLCEATGIVLYARAGETHVHGAGAQACEMMGGLSMSPDKAAAAAAASQHGSQHRHSHHYDPAGSKLLLSDGIPALASLSGRGGMAMHGAALCVEEPGHHTDSGNEYEPLLTPTASTMSTATATPDRHHTAHSTPASVSMTGITAHGITAHGSPSPSPGDALLPNRL